MSIFSKAKKLFVSFLAVIMLAPAAFGAGRDKPEKNQSPTPVVQNDDPISTYPGRVKGKVPGVTTVKIDQDEEKVPPSLKMLWRAMQRLDEEGKVMGPELVEFSEKANVLFCRDTLIDAWDPELCLSKLSSDTATVVRKALEDLGYTGKGDTYTAATWNDFTGLITVGGPLVPADSNHVLIAQTHELVHAIQRVTRVKKMNYAWPVWDYQASLLSYEAAASTGEKVMALELLSSDTNFWLSYMMFDRVGSDLVFDAYTKAIRNDKSYESALEEAGRAAFYRQFQYQWWLDSYNTTVFCRYLEWALQNKLETQTQDRYTVKTMRKTGYISEDFNLTARLDSIPSNMFGNNEGMRQAFDWVNLLHLERTVGANSGAYLFALEKMKKDNNPYIGADPWMVYHTLDACNLTLPVTSILAYYSPPKQVIKPTIEKKQIPRFDSR